MPLNQIDCVYNRCYMHIMIKEAFRQGKNFIVAKVNSLSEATFPDEEEQINDKIDYDDNERLAIEC